MFSWSDIFTPGAQTQSEAEANYAAQKKKLEAQALQRMADEDYGWFETNTAAINQAALSAPLENKNVAAVAGFKEGLADGVENIKGAVTGFGPFKLIPAWVWIGGALALFWWVGGLAWIKGALKKSR